MDSLTNALPKLLEHLAQLLDGSTGLALIVVSLTARLALLPLTYRSARRSWRQQRQLAAIKPQIEALRERHHDDPRALVQATQALHRRHGIPMMSVRNLMTGLIQMPVVLTLYAAIRRGAAHAGRFLWIGNLGRPDMLLALIVAALAGFAALLNPALPEQAHTLLQLLPVLITFFVVWHLSAGLGLYWAASNSVNIAQMLLLRRHAAAQQATAANRSRR